MGTHYRGTPAEVRALDAHIKMARAQNTVRSHIVSRLAGLGFTENQFGILEAVYHLGPTIQRDLGTKMLTSGGNVTMVVDQLEKRGLVRRVRNPDCRRQVHVHLTDAGRRLIEEVFPGHVQFIREEYSALTAAEQEELARLCRKLGLGATRLREPG